jgi:uncharacterized membrane protein YphA (DoxX/SURF4 family)
MKGQQPARPWWRRGLSALLAMLAVAGGAWGALALYFGLRAPSPLPGLLAAGFVLAMAGCLLVLSGWRRWVAAAGVFAVVLAWWASLTPSNDHVWEPEYSQTASASREGDTIRFHNIRNAAWSPDGTAQLAYYDADFQLSQLDEVDLICSYWAGDNIAHVFLSFGFKDGRHLAVSVETRRERGDAYSALAGFFRRYELIYVVADERDLIGARTDARRERVYLYRLRATPAEQRALFLSYVDRIHTLAEKPEFYNTLLNNCTTSVVGRANAAAHVIPYSWMILLSGHADRYAYDLGRMDSDLSFEALKRASLIQRPDDAVPDAGFSAEIRRGLP